MNGKRITSKEVDNVKLLLEKGLNMRDISEIMNIGKGTVSRIANGKHCSQQLAVKKEVEVAESETQLDRIERKLDLLLSELM